MECKKAGIKPCDDFRVDVESTCAGLGIAVFACAQEVMERMKKAADYQAVGFDKMNMLRHARYFKNLDGIMAHMDKQAELLRPKFKTVLDAFERELGGRASWNGSIKQRYFISSP